MAAGRKIEVEMKYKVATAGAGDRYLVAPALGSFAADGPVRSVQVEDRYVDSADWSLARAGFAARLRKTQHGTIIGLKALNASTGTLQRREEIEGPADAGLIPGDWPGSGARTVVMELCGDAALMEVLTIRQLRRIRPLRASAAKAELSVDEVEVVAAGRVIDSFEELEVELKRGDEAPLMELAGLFDTDETLRPLSRSKLERAVEAMTKALPSMPPEVRSRWATAPLGDLLPEPKAGRRRRRVGAERGGDRAAEGEAEATTSAAGVVVGVGVGVDDSYLSGGPAAPASDDVVSAPDEAGSEARAIAEPTAAAAELDLAKPGPRTLGIVAEDSMPEAAIKVLRYHFGKMQHREAGTRSGVDTEELHNMRVATRRMRAAWRVFDGAFKAGKTKKMRRHLEILADRLGAVRDLDVLIEGLEAYRLGLDEDQREGLEPLHSLWTKQRASARTQLIGELDSERYVAFTNEMEAFLDAGANAAAAVPAPTAPHRVRDRAASRVWAAYEAVRSYQLVLAWADVETLHDLRISAKWLRYTLEFFGETLGPDAPRLLARVVALQDHLGSLHDADVATKLARDLLVARAGQLSKLEADAIGAYLHSREREVARRRRALGPIWRAVEGAPFRRGLGRAAAAL